MTIFFLYFDSQRSSGSLNIFWIAVFQRTNLLCQSIAGRSASTSLFLVDGEKEKRWEDIYPFLLRQVQSYCSNAIRAVSNVQSNNSTQKFHTSEHNHISRRSPGKAACFHTSYAGRPLLLAVARQGGGCSLLCTLSQGLDCLQHSQGEVIEKSEEL